jgi:hypothetical protein
VPTAKISKRRTQAKQRETSVVSDTPICFVISPIGADGTERHKKFKDVLEYLIKPAIKNSGYNLNVVRADDIERAGSFIKDILTSLLDSHVVIADLTEQNPNVFYELGVRHSLSPRTILIAQSIDEIPSDLREYRAIVYDMTLEGASVFTNRLTNFLKQIFAEPHRPDNPVLDRLQSIIEQKTVQLEQENIELKKQLSSFFKRGEGEPKATPVQEETVEFRMERILKLHNAERTYSGSFTRGEGRQKQAIKFPNSMGNFQLYAPFKRADVILDLWYVSVVENDVNFERQLADIRVITEQCSQGQDMPCKFIIATSDDLTGKVSRIRKAFTKIKSFVNVEARGLFTLEIWDKKGLLQKEKELGIKVDI